MFPDDRPRHAKSYGRSPKPRFEPIPAAANLTGGLVEIMAAQIESGRLAPGQRLPTEQALVAATGVSRTVVREALASLRARGLITTRQGLGAFVAVERTRKSFTIAQADVSADDERQLFELRVGIEVEAAGLAATRRSAADVALLRTRLEQAVTNAGQSGDDVDADFAFHRAILASAGNPHFGGVFEVLADVLMRRERATLRAMPADQRATYVRRLRRDREAIVDAIERGDAPAARRAIRRQLNRDTARA